MRLSGVRDEKHRFRDEYNHIRMKKDSLSMKMHYIELR